MPEQNESAEEPAMQPDDHEVLPEDVDITIEAVAITTIADAIYEHAEIEGSGVLVGVVPLATKVFEAMEARNVFAQL